MASKKSSSVADFVRTMPNATAAEVVKAAKGKGIKTSEAYVRWVRWSDGQGGRAAGKKAAAKAGRPRRAAAPSRGAAAKEAPKASASTEATFRRMVLDLGVPRAKRMVDEIDRRLREIVGG